MTALVAVAGGVLVEMHMASGSADPAAAALAAIPASHSANLLEKERQQMILVDAASQTLTMVGNPKMATSQASLSGGSSGSGSGSGSTSVLVNMPPPDPGTAQSTAFGLLSSYGFASSQWGCLDDLWQRESGWVYNAENASGAYGIPQALPGSKMASAGPDWQTNPTTQIKWGLGYIKSVYGTPCGAWSHEEADGWY
jgi:resuscitation-promoting factor RpfB